MPNNICKFVAQENNGGDLYPLHYVFETHEQIFDKWRILAHYRMHYVYKGNAVLHTQNGKFELKKGDVFFCFPSVPYGLESVSDFQYYYIGYTGTRALRIMNKLDLNEKNCVFLGFEQTENLWKMPLNFSPEAIKYYSEGILLCVFAEIANKQSNFSQDKIADVPIQMKKYIDDNMSNSELSLDMIAKHFSYNKKYLSKIFHQEFKITFSKYLCNIRIQNACSLIEKGFKSIQDIAYNSGFPDALYFSKCFKNVMGVSPTQHIQDIKNQKKQQSKKQSDEKQNDTQNGKN